MCILNLVFSGAFNGRLGEWEDLYAFSHLVCARLLSVCDGTLTCYSPLLDYSSSNNPASLTTRLGATIDVEQNHVRFLGDLILNLWDCGGQDSFMESYLTSQRSTIFQQVGVLIWLLLRGDQLDIVPPCRVRRDRFTCECNPCVYLRLKRFYL